MWQLTCDVDLLDGQAVWLRPGSRHLLGRTSSRSVAGEQIRFIDHKNISRKHLLLQVSVNKPGDSSQAHVRSIVTAEDGSKTGTIVNGRKIVGEKVELDRTDNELQLGTSEYIFHIKWVPVVITCANLPKSDKSKETSLAAYRSKLQQTDIKVVAEYISAQTTHVLGSKRNNPPVLQALAHGRWPVSYAFLEKLGEATRSKQTDSDCSLDQSLLEQDLAASWPQETDYLIDSAGEPISRPNELLMPNTARSDLFSGLMFVFLVQAQYETLMPVVTACGGKAFLREVDFGVTTAADITSYLRELSAAKPGSRASFQKIVVIEPMDKNRESESIAMNDALVAELGRPCFSQRNFLDVILTLDKSALQLPEPNPVDEDMDVTVVDKTDSPAPIKSEYNRFRKPNVQSRFKGFEDFDIESIAPAPSPSPSPEPAIHDTVMQDQNEQPDASRKRNADHLSESTITKRPCILEQDKAKPKKKQIKPEQAVEEANVKLQAQKWADEEARLQQEKDLKVKLAELDLEQYNDCAQVEEFEVKMPDVRPGTTATEQRSSRGWNPEWNGRPNFKAFRKHGEAANVRPRAAFVTLEEATEADVEGTQDDVLDEESPIAFHRLNGAVRHSDHSQAASNRTISGEYVGTPPDETVRNGTLKRSANTAIGGQAKRTRQIGRNAPVTIDDDDDEFAFRRTRR